MFKKCIFASYSPSAVKLHWAANTAVRLNNGIFTLVNKQNIWKKLNITQNERKHIVIDFPQSSTYEKWRRFRGDVRHPILAKKIGPVIWNFAIAKNRSNTSCNSNKKEKDSLTTGLAPPLFFPPPSEPQEKGGGHGGPTSPLVSAPAADILGFFYFVIAESVNENNTRFLCKMSIYSILTLTV